MQRVGIIGSGQLGRMLIDALKMWNVPVNVLSTSLDAPCCGIADSIVLTDSLHSPTDIDKLAENSDVIVCEIEHTNTEKLRDLDIQVIPCPKILELIQHKCLQKEFYETNDIPTCSFIIVEKNQPFRKPFFKKCVVKSDKGGYDGKGVSVYTRDELPTNFQEKVLIEQFTTCKKELSVMVACDGFGNYETWPCVEMVFKKDANLLDYMICPTKEPIAIRQKARRLAIKTIKNLKKIGDVMGIFAVEMFLDSHDKLYVNEIAPRPHNSGHHTIEAMYTSQYEQLARIVLNLPMVENIEMKSCSAMINIIGPDDFVGEYKIDNLPKLLAFNRVYVHDYGKKISKPNRKLGHITILGQNIDVVQEKLSKIKSMGISITKK